MLWRSKVCNHVAWSKYYDTHEPQSSRCNCKENVMYMKMYKYKNVAEFIKSWFKMINFPLWSDFTFWAADHQSSFTWVLSVCVRYTTAVEKTFILIMNCFPPGLSVTAPVPLASFCPPTPLRIQPNKHPPCREDVPWKHALYRWC